MLCLIFYISYEHCPNLCIVSRISSCSQEQAISFFQ